MKLKIFFVLFSFTILIYPWGDEGHSLIGSKAIENLPEEMKEFQQWQEYIALHSVDPDYRKKYDKSEDPKHFIDIDFYKEFLSGRMIQDKMELINAYNDSIVNKMGILPWASFDTYINLKKAFIEKNRDKILIYVSDLCHYAADGHQPMHIMLNYNGQLSGQTGIHGRYEIEMVHNYLSEIESSITKQNISLITDPLNFIFNYMTESYFYGTILFEADETAYKEAGSRNSEDYYRLLWFRTKPVTLLLFNNAVRDASSLIYSAWVEAGRPNLTELI